MQNPILEIFHTHTQIPVIIALAGKLRSRQFMQFIIVRYEHQSLILIKNLLIESLNNASMLNKVFFCNAHSLSEILAEHVDDALGLGGVDKVEATFDQSIVEGCDVVVVAELGVEVAEDVSSHFDFCERS